MVMRPEGGASYADFSVSISPSQGQRGIDDLMAEAERSPF